MAEPLPCWTCRDCGRCGVARRAEPAADGVAHGELAHVGFADDDGAGCFQIGDYGSVGVRHEVGADFGGVGGADAGGVYLVFDADGNAVQRTAEVPGGGFGLQLLGVGRLRRRRP